MHASSCSPSGSIKPLTLGRRSGDAPLLPLSALFCGDGGDTLFPLLALLLLLLLLLGFGSA